MTSELQIEFWSAVFSAIVSLLATGIIGAFVWYFRKYVISEIEANSAHRRRAEGENPYEDEGKLDRVEERLNEMQTNREEEHAETRQQLEFLTEYIQRIAAAINREVEGAEVRNPKTNEPDFYRGGDSDD